MPFFCVYSSTANTNYNNRILGDATGEMGPFQSIADPDGLGRNKSSWYYDFGGFLVNYNPWLIRGGYWCQGVASGIFAFENYSGGRDSFISFRVVLAP